MVIIDRKKDTFQLEIMQASNRYILCKIQTNLFFIDRNLCLWLFTIETS